MHLKISFANELNVWKQMTISDNEEYASNCEGHCLGYINRRY